MRYPISIPIHCTIQGRIQDFQIDGAQKIIVNVAHIPTRSAKSLAAEVQDPLSLRAVEALWF